MASTKAEEAEEAAWSIKEIAAMSDAELGQFMKKRQRPDGSYGIPIHDGWDTLSKEERNRLAERLKAQQQILAQSPTANARPHDLDDPDARLRQGSSDSRFSLLPEPQAIAPSQSPTVTYDWRHYYIQVARKAYQDLVEDGGRPLYPIDLITDIAENPEEYVHAGFNFDRGSERFCAPNAGLNMFSSQLWRWKYFRDWQKVNRGLDIVIPDLPAFFENLKELRKLQLPAKRYLSAVANLEARPEIVKGMWESERLVRERRADGYRKDYNGFVDYAKAVKNRLARHDFALPLEFELSEDPKKQDPLTTWIEYLTYEYWWLDSYTDTLRNLELGYDKAWQKLMDDNVVGPRDTIESIQAFRISSIREHSEKDAMSYMQGLEAEAKKIPASTQEDPLRLSIPQAKRTRMLRNISTKLAAAKGEYRQIKKRNLQINTFIRGMSGGVNAEHDIARQQALLKWILGEVPLVMAERAQSEAARPKKRPVTADNEEPLGERSVKRSKLDHQESESLTNSSRNISNPKATSKASSEPLAAVDQEGDRGDGGGDDNGIRPIPRGRRRRVRFALP
ncbi:hypothetical protein EDB81DRAFT_195059 [Dactylonectria macrodidyma]|uniref:Uncharacterized protein n=1 Tax=Dactylonectria macrodidyma TaxID=307937 RepID=A0A9P9JLU6_9HYPO|nr:hypothetical protein EDB81DRAFT_195059 [Dactylonectria macrodidyma]